MTLRPESSNRGRGPHRLDRVESLAGAFHPHAIEVQDFSYYDLIVDVRTCEEYEDDHIPGAVNFPPAVVGQGPLTTGSPDEHSLGLVARDNAALADLPPALAAAVARVKLDQAILVYCGCGGLDSLPVARALRWRGWSVDVLPGGWINYRRWVQAGIEVLPRLIGFRVIATSLACEADRVLAALAAVGHQVLNIEAMMVRRRGALSVPAMPQPPQAWFESLLLQRLRAFDPRRPVWVADVDPQVGGLHLPGGLVDPLACAPTALLDAPIRERAQRWIDDEPAWASPLAAIDRVATWQPPPGARLLRRWKSLARTDLAALVDSVLADHVDRQAAERLAQRISQPNALAPLVTDSLAADRLALAVRAWQPAPADDPD